MIWKWKMRVGGLKQLSRCARTRTGKACPAITAGVPWNDSRDGCPKVMPGSAA